jgi:hypothetical protein
MQEYEYTNVMLLRAVVLLVPAALLFSYSLVLSKRKVPWAALQLLGARDRRDHARL